jgi:hypothetical protein
MIIICDKTGKELGDIHCLVMLKDSVTIASLTQAIMENRVDIFGDTEGLREVNDLLAVLRFKKLIK